MVRRPRGTRDFLPEEMQRRLALERLFDEVACRHGFQRVATPTFESLDLFTAKSGQGIVDELYTFEDKGGRPLTLRPELPAPVMRMVAAEMTHVPHPLRLSYFGNCFRYEEFKTGRYREFWQYGCEIVGATGSLVEAETIAFATALVTASGLDGWRCGLVTLEFYEICSSRLVSSTMRGEKSCVLSIRGILMPSRVRFQR